MNKIETLNVDNEYFITHAALEDIVDRFSWMTLGELREYCHDRSQLDFIDASWLTCLAAIADWEHNVDDSPYRIDYRIRCQRCQWNDSTEHWTYQTGKNADDVHWVTDHYCKTCADDLLDDPEPTGRFGPQ